jgi:hypothetical protein
VWLLTVLINLLTKVKFLHFSKIRISKQLQTIFTHLYLMDKLPDVSFGKTDYLFLTEKCFNWFFSNFFIFCFSVLVRQRREAKRGSHHQHEGRQVKVSGERQRQTCGQYLKLFITANTCYYL